MTAVRVLTGATLALACASPAIAADGAKIFAETCQACHQPGGVGAPGLAPPLVSPIIANAASRQPDYPARVVMFGLSGTLPLAGGEAISSAMPPQQGLSDDQIAAVVGYVFRLNRAKASIKPADVARIRSQPGDSVELKRLRTGLAP